jgi:hypothetical protein
MNIHDSAKEMFVCMLEFFFLCLVKFAIPQIEDVDLNEKHYVPHTNILYEETCLRKPKKFNSSFT